MKPTNDAWSYEVFLFLDGFYGWWQVGSGLHWEYGTNLYCFQADGYLPSGCAQWYDAHLSEMGNLRVYACSAEDVTVPLQCSHRCRRWQRRRRNGL